MNIHKELNQAINEMIDRRTALNVEAGADPDWARRSALAYVLGYVQSCYAGLLYECDKEKVQQELDYLKKV